MAWSQDRVARLLEEFVPCADEVWRLQRGKGCESDVFRSFAEDGHYANRRGKSGTRQGIFVVTPKGDLLVSWNSRRPEVVERNLRAALREWKGLRRRERLPEEDLFEGVERPEDLFPKGGLALRVFSRDLPRPKGAELPDDWRARAWNIDHFWLTQAEAKNLAEGRLPRGAAVRLARLHARDNVRGQTNPFPEEAVRSADLRARVVSRRGRRVELALSGEVHAEESGRWRIDDRAPETEQTRSFEGAFHGSAIWDGERFTAFELALAGTRVGGTRYNERKDDLGPAPLGVVLELAPEDDRVAPSLLWVYGWSR
ncbi:MAG: hypothetical protein AAFP86_00930 [Planctomycetota bacterium]